MPRSEECWLCPSPVSGCQGVCVFVCVYTAFIDTHKQENKQHLMCDWFVKPHSQDSFHYYVQ